MENYKVIQTYTLDEHTALLEVNLNLRPITKYDTMLLYETLDLVQQAELPIMYKLYSNTYYTIRYDNKTSCHVYLCWDSKPTKKGRLLPPTAWSVDPKV